LTWYCPLATGKSHSIGVPPASNRCVWNRAAGVPAGTDAWVTSTAVDVLNVRLPDAATFE
jgi:hypothetical protein